MSRIQEILAQESPDTTDLRNSVSDATSALADVGSIATFSTRWLCPLFEVTSRPFGPVFTSYMDRGLYTRVQARTLEGLLVDVHLAATAARDLIQERKAKKASKKQQKAAPDGSPAPDQGSSNPGALS